MIFTTLCTSNYVVTFYLLYRIVWLVPIELIWCDHIRELYVAEADFNVCRVAVVVISAGLSLSGSSTAPNLPSTLIEINSAQLLTTSQRKALYFHCKIANHFN